MISYKPRPRGRTPSARRRGWLHTSSFSSVLGSRCNVPFWPAGSHGPHRLLSPASPIALRGRLCLPTAYSVCVWFCLLATLFWLEARTAHIQLNLQNICRDARCSTETSTRQNIKNTTIPKLKSIVQICSIHGHYVRVHGRAGRAPLTRSWAVYLGLPEMNTAL